MTDYSKEMLRKTLIPVLLGGNRRSFAISSRLWFFHGLRSYICDSKRRFFAVMDPLVTAFELFSDTDDDMIFEALCYISDNTDYLPILVPCSQKFELFVKRNAERLETRFIISSAEELFSTAPLSAL